MKVAMTDMDIIWEQKEENKEQCLSMIKEASEQKADVILFPEMTLTGFSMDVENIRDKKGESIRFFSDLAKKIHIAIGFGYVTEEEKKGRNHFCFLDKEGRVSADYEKIHPFTYGGENRFYAGGKKLCHFSFEDFTCGLFICYDLRFPEVFQSLPEATDVVFLIANWPKARMEHWYTLLQARAIEMQCYVVGINRIGEGNGIKYEKSSVTFSPEGKRLSEVEGERNRYIEIDRDSRLRYVEEFPTRKDRRPDIYFA
ncbi:MAG: carbon-nitrogen family hydrolase [Lachnospiraceae bacterium]|nr:carbon-nitrogen family hydrolase [Lachnospiraceae bacterium]